MPLQTKPVAESRNFIVLNNYVQEWKADATYQSEDDLERELIRDLTNQGYEYLTELTTPKAMLANVRTQLQTLNNIEFTNTEWQRFVETWLDRPSDDLIGKSRKIHEDWAHDFKFDDGHIQNIYLLDKRNLARNKLQVIRQFEQKGTHTNRYDVTLLINGLPLVHIELKKRGVAIREAFNQIHRYSKESFNSENSLYKYLQMFVISNGTDTRYFANTTKRDKNSFDFTMNWAQADNSPIKDLKDFTATFLQKNTLLNVLLKYSVLDTSNSLLIMRPYQIAATERILWKIASSFDAKNLNKPESGGFIWHTTGSGKTLTSFKTARLATDLEFIDKVFFVVDRKDLDYQTMKEYQRFSPKSVNGSINTAALKKNLAKDDNKIIVTTIQKLNNLMKSDDALAAYTQSVVFIFDECHRGQFGEAQRNLKKRFKRFCQFGFTGTPIFPENAAGAATTTSVFGQQLHAYVITDAIRDEKVLKFKVDYNDVRPRFRASEREQDEEKSKAAETKQALQHPERIREIAKYILNNFRRKTHRLHGDKSGFNALFAVSSVEAAKLYYSALHELQAEQDKPLKIATIFSFASNEQQDALGDIPDESLDFSEIALNPSSKEFLETAITDYNNYFKTSYNIEGDNFQNYYRDLAKRVRSKEVDLLIVVGMFLTGFDAPTLNTLFVDKNVRFHGLIQAYSRTNRIYNKTKRFGNIVSFRDLEQATIDAITLFGDANTLNIILEKSYQEYMKGYTDAETGEVRRGFIEVSTELAQRFPDPAKIVREADKKDFAKTFGEYLRLENILRNYDEFATLTALQSINDEASLEAFQREHFLSDEELADLQSIEMLTERTVQDYRSTYNDIRDWLRQQREAVEEFESTVDWDNVVFEVDLLKSQEINLDYILEQIFQSNRAAKNKSTIIENVRRMIRASVGHRAKESLLVAFINHTDLNALKDAPSVIQAFFTFAKAEQQREAEALIKEENLNDKAAKRYIANSIKREFASEHGKELNDILPETSPLDPQYLSKKNSVFAKISAFVEKFKGVGGQI
ncbi:MAG: type I restriction endonuclease subunit R [Aestuariivita sp.]|nr:type I restriction endonuclease subunit R [Aestuariivita sp.]MCY4345840.1 type I restriction endonuclease subunit R [Aestuariivita sp.]